MSNLVNAEAELLTKINEAVAAAHEAEKAAETAKGELVSRSKTLGLLLLEGKKLHRKVEDFEAFLKKVPGIKSLSWAYDCMRVAGGRTTDEQLRKDARERQQKVRDAAKAARVAAAEAAKVSVMSRNPPAQLPAPKQPPPPPADENSAEVSTEKRMAENAASAMTAEEKEPNTYKAPTLDDFVTAIKCVLALGRDASLLASFSENKKNKVEKRLKDVRSLLDLVEPRRPAAKGPDPDALLRNWKGLALPEQLQQRIDAATEAVIARRFKGVKIERAWDVIHQMEKHRDALKKTAAAIAANGRAEAA